LKSLRMRGIKPQKGYALMSLRAASRAVSLASPGSNGDSFDRKFIIPSGLIPNFKKRCLI
jgi:hypothetical protein